MTQTEKLSRQEIMNILRARDGAGCQYPGCTEPLDFSAEGPKEVTIDHWIPQFFGRENNWTYEQIRDTNNLKLMHKRCNAKKGDLIPNDDGTLPAKPQSKFRYRRQKRAGRPEFCAECNNGHDLAADEVCANCGCNAQRYPRWAKVKFQECDHELFWCIWCSIGVVERPSSIGTAMRQADSDELGEWNEDSELGE